MVTRRRWLLSSAASLLVVTSARAADPIPANPPTVRPDQNESIVLDEIDVVARRLDLARSQIQPSLGATKYNFGRSALETIPQSDNAPLNQVLLQAPVVAQDSFGQIHLRGFGADELAYISQHDIHLDHDQRWTASAGWAYTVNADTSYPTRISASAVSGSGLRASTATVPNGRALPTYAVVNLSVVQKLNVGVGKTTELRMDVLNVADARYEIRDGTGVGVGAPQYGLRRALLAGLAQRF